MNISLRLGDCMEVMASMQEGSVGAIVCDPPYGLEFMGKDWDNLAGDITKTKGSGDWAAAHNTARKGFDGYGAIPNYIGGGNIKCPDCGRPVDGRDPSKPHPRKGYRCVCGGARRERARRASHAIQDWHAQWLSQAFRILEPGGAFKAFSGSRTFHHLAASMQRVGFSNIQLEAWGYATGFPKSLNVAKAIDKRAGTDPETQAQIQSYLKERREALGLSKAEVDRQVFGGTTRYGWVEGRGGVRGNEVYLPTPEEWVDLKACLHLDDRFDDYIKKAIPSRSDRFRSDGGKAALVREEEGDWGYQGDGERWDGTRRVTAPKTPEARMWDGWGTALKPAWEPVLIGRKP